MEGKAVRTTDEVIGKVDVSNVDNGALSKTEFNALSGVRESVQTQLDNKTNLDHTHAADDIVAGVLPIARGGTGENNAEDGFTELSPMTGKGDIAVHNGTKVVRVPVGPNGYVLTADSSRTLGLRWAANSGGGGGSGSGSNSGSGGGGNQASGITVNFYAASNSTSSTTSTSWKSKCTLDFDAYEGEYLIQWSYKIKTTHGQAKVKVRVEHDGNEISEVDWRPGNTNCWAPGGGFEKIYLDSDDHEFKIEYCSSKSGKSVSVKEVRIFALYLG